MKRVSLNTKGKKESWHVAWTLSLIVVLYPVLFGFPHMILSWDVFAYYLYLPLTFIYNDLNLSNPDTLHQLMEQYNISDTLYQAYPIDNGNWMIKTSMGMSVCYAPFFFIGHITALGTDYAVDGFSAPYQWAMIMGSLFYTVLGIWLFRQLLLHFFGERHAALLLVFVVLGTNYLILNTESMMMSHVPLFTAMCALLLVTISWHRHPTTGRSILLGGLMGLMALSRPTEALVAIIPLLWGIDSLRAAKEKIITLFTRNLRYLIIILAVGAIMVLPQFMYWKWVSGQWVYMSYNNPAEGLDLDTPHTLKFLFSFRKGWYIYTPIMLLATLGFAALWKYRRDFFWPLFVFFCFNIYVVSSWTTWWYAFSFSQRAVVQSYPIMAIALGYGLRFARRNGDLTKHLVVGLCFLCTGLNLFQSWQFKQGIIHGERMTERYYWKVFGRLSVPEGAEKWLLVERSGTAEEHFANPNDYHQPVLHYDDFERDIPEDQKETKEGVLALHLSPHTEFSPTWTSSFQQITKADHAWIECKAMVWVPSWDDAGKINIVCTFLHGDWAYKYHAFPLSRYLSPQDVGKWTPITFHYLTPEPRKLHDPVKLYFWNQMQGEAWIANVTVQSYERKW